MNEHVRKAWRHRHERFGSVRPPIQVRENKPLNRFEPVPVLVIDNTPEARENQVGRAALIYVRNIDAEEDANEERRQRGEVQTWSSPHDRMAAVFAELFGPPVEPEP